MIFVLYLYRRFLPVFAGALAFFALVLMLVDLLMNLWQYIANQVPPADILKIMILYFPKAVSFSLPLSILFAVSYTLSDMYAKNELTAVFASGVSLLHFTLPLLLVSLLLSAVLFFFEDIVVVPSYADKTRLQNSLLGQARSKDNDQIVIMSEGGRTVYKADYYSDEIQTLRYLTVVFRNPDASLRSVVIADKAVWNGRHWELYDAVQYSAEDDMMAYSAAVPVSESERLIEPPETFRNNTVSVDEVSIKEARSYITHLQRAGLPAADAQAQYYKKFSFPFIVFIVVFLSIGLSGKSRKNVLLVSLILSIGAAVLFYVSQMVTMLLAQFGYISPFAGAWIPVILFIFLSSVLLKFART